MSVNLTNSSGTGSTVVTPLGGVPKRKRSSRRYRRDLGSPCETDEEGEVDSICGGNLRTPSLTSTPSRRSRSSYHRQQL
ncbi:hypothetical protein M8J75_009619 [Diaphorina citri]|nr:hypothetical protein M8J75_002938 [Diaphorina citri]KAI5692598.1 hypothetical protein M8J75_009619 [Diaphorina citri]KAI5748236.1 hypothetical protein M8J77_023345 [Diaphorina citri]